MTQPTAETALRALEPLIGDWTMTATWPNGESWPGRMTFEWMDSRSHILQRGSLEHPQAPDNVSVIGCDGANGTYIQLYSDERGVCRIVQMSISADEIRFWRDGEPFSQRFTGRFIDGGNTITGYWEMAEDGINFHKDFDLVFTRLA